MLKKIRRLLSFTLFLFSSTMLIWSYLPIQHQVDVKILLPSTMCVVSNGQVDKPALLKSRLVKLEWPKSMRIGEQEMILMDFEIVNPNGSLPEVPTEYSDAYLMYTVMAEAKFEIAGIRVEPANPTRESMPPGEPVRFKWVISAEQAGENSGNLWLSLRFLPLDGSTPIQVPIYVKVIGIHTISLLGLSGPMAQLVGWVGVILSFLLVFNDMINRVRRWKGKIATQGTADIKEK